MLCKENLAKLQQITELLLFKGLGSGFNILAVLEVHEGLNMFLMVGDRIHPMDHTLTWTFLQTLKTYLEVAVGWMQKPTQAYEHIAHSNLNRLYPVVLTKLMSKFLDDTWGGKQLTMTLAPLKAMVQGSGHKQEHQKVTDRQAGQRSVDMSCMPCQLRLTCSQANSGSKSTSVTVTTTWNAPWLAPQVSDGCVFWCQKMLISTIGIQDALTSDSSAEVVNLDVAGRKWTMGDIQCQYPKQARVNVREVDMSDST